MITNKLFKSSLLKKGTQFYYWFISFIVVVLSCTALILILYLVTSASLKNQIEDNMDYTVNQVCSFYDSDFSTIQNNTYNLLSESTLQYLSSGKPDNNYFVRSQQYKTITRNISSILSHTNSIDQFFVIFDKHDLVLDQNGSSTKQNLFDAHFKNYYPDMETWLKEIYECDGYSNVNVLKGADGKIQFCYIQKTPVTSPRPKAIAIVTLNMNTFVNERLGMVKTTLPILSILDENNDVIFSFPETSSIEKSGKYISVTQKSAFGNLKYELKMPTSSVYGDYNNIQYLSILIFILLAIVAFSLSYHFAQKNYRPLFNLVQIFGEETILENQNEFIYLEDKINTIIKNKKKLEEASNSDKKRINELYLCNLVLGKTPPKNNHEIIFSKTFYTIVLFNVNDCGILYDNSDMKEEHSLIYYAIENVFTELLENSCDCYYFTCDNMFACIVNSDNEYIESDIYEKSSFAIDFLKNSFSTEIICAVSNVTTEQEGLSTLYNQAKEIINMSPFLKEGTVINPQVIGNTPYSFNKETEQMLLICIKNGDYAGSSRIINNLFTKNLDEKNLRSNVIKIFLSDLTGTLLKVSPLCTETDTFFVQLIDYMNADDYDSVLTLMLSHIKFLCKSNDVINKNKSTNERTEQIIRFVQENFCDPALNVSYIANKYNITPSYLSTSFKSKTNTSLYEYIQGLRIEKAAELMKNQVPVSDAYQKCGFYDINAFIRSFKKTYGVTPGKYAAELKKQQDK